MPRPSPSERRGEDRREVAPVPEHCDLNRIASSDDRDSVPLDIAFACCSQVQDRRGGHQRTIESLGFRFELGGKIAGVAEELQRLRVVRRDKATADGRGVVVALTKAGIGRLAEDEGRRRRGGGRRLGGRRLARLGDGERRRLGPGLCDAGADLLCRGVARESKYLNRTASRSQECFIDNPDPGT